MQGVANFAEKDARLYEVGGNIGKSKESCKNKESCKIKESCESCKIKETLVSQRNLLR